MPRASQSEQTGSVGIAEALGKFARIGFGYAEINRHDNGTDVFLIVRDSRRFEPGLTLAAQVKGGPYWFRRPKRASDGTVEGWWFEDSTGEHIDSWLSYGLPHLLVIHHLDDDISYWVHVTPEAVRSTGNGKKILVPANQKVDADSHEELVRIASIARRAPRWEGSSWRGADSLPSRALLRHALLAPRLLAPHPNAHIAEPLTAPQAAAMALQARIVDLEELEERGMVLRVDDAAQSAQWAWRLYAAVHHRITTGDVEALRATLESAPEAPERASAAAAAAGCLFEEDRADDAVGVLEVMIANDEAEPVDHAWLLVQLARAQVGRAADVRSLAAAVQAVAATHSDDVTATAIAGVGANILLSLQDWTDQVDAETDALGSAIEGSDTAVTWWRQQVAGWATAAALDRTFLAWTRDTSRRWSRSDAANDQLLAASLNATLVGDHGQWAALTGLLAKDILVRAGRHTDPERVRAGLTSLRVSGRHQDLALAARRIVEDGPAQAAADAARDNRLESVTHTEPSRISCRLRVGGVAGR